MTGNPTRRILPGLLVTLALGAAPFGPSTALAAPPKTGGGYDSESYLTDWAANLTRELDLDSLALPTEEDLRDLGKQVDAYFATGSLDDIAWVLPEAREALALCDEVPTLKPYGDWLRQRMDYLEVASKLVRLYPPQKPLPPYSRPSTLNRFSLPRPPPPPPVTAAMLVKREAALRSRDTWLKTLLNRPIPAEGIKLVPIVKKVFEEEGLPPQLIWIAEVESTFNPRAKSPSGAVGLFQLMPDTAERLGLRLFPTDQRRSSELNARAAARYLRFLYEEFGSWPLAVAGYNAGEGRVGRALQKSGKTTFDGIASILPLQTRLYVPKVATVIELREKANLAKLPAPKPAEVSDQ
jgi:membrane-bound lytic murein transglycosylase D